MTSQTYKKPAGGNLRADVVEASSEAGHDIHKSTSAPAECKPLADQGVLPLLDLQDFNLDPERSALGIDHPAPGAPDVRDAPTRGAYHDHRDRRDHRDDPCQIDAGHEDPLILSSTDMRHSRHGPRFECLVGQSGFQDGVHWIGVERDRRADEFVELDPEWICSPLKIAATTHDGTGNNWGRLLVFADRAGSEHRWAMPMSMLAGSGDELRAELLRQGLEITSQPRLRARILDYIQREDPSVGARCVSRTGWNGNVFVLPDRTYGDSEGEPVIFQTSTPDGIALSQRGTLNEWRAQVALPCAGNTRLVLAISCAFAGPCLGLVDAEGGGVHFRGGSSVGKSTALAIAASVYGPPKYALTWRQTDNALEGVAAWHSDLLLVLDEMGQLDPKSAGQTAYMLANGRGKGRARRDGSPRAAAAFRVLFLSSGEIGLQELMAEDGKKVRAGQEVRVVDVPADAGRNHGLFETVPEGLAAGQFADRLKTAAGQHFGGALPAFLEALTKDLDNARATVLRKCDQIADALSAEITDGQVRRVARRFALIAAAGELATSYGLTGWNPGEAEEAARVCFSDWCSARGSKGNAEPAAMLAHLRQFLELHGEARFAWWNDPYVRTPNRAGFRKSTDEGPEYYIEREVFTREVLKGFDPREAIRVLLACGALMSDSDGSATRMERLPDKRHVRVYRITPKVWHVEV